MFFEDNPKVDAEHPLYWLEDIVQFKVWSDETKRNEEHVAEHDAMKKHWNLSETTALRFPPPPHKTGNNRAYHILLHLKYWKEVGMNLDVVAKYEEQGLDKLEEVPVPENNVPEAGY